MRVPDLSGNTPYDPTPSMWPVDNPYTGPAAASPAIRWPGGRGTYRLRATGYGGATNVRLQWSRDPAANFIDLDTTNANFTADGICGFEAAPGYLRTNITGGTGVTAMVATADRVLRAVGG